tara:strand:+ start:62 stop:340 length:279 start_codon:yes stop_codon:yes gene_type:complete
MKIVKITNKDIKKRLVTSITFQKYTRVALILTLVGGFFYTEFLLLCILLFTLVMANDIHIHLDKLRLEIRSESRELARFILGTQTQTYRRNL